MQTLDSKLVSLLLHSVAWSKLSNTSSSSWPWSLMLTLPLGNVDSHFSGLSLRSVDFWLSGVGTKSSLKIESESWNVKEWI